MQWGGLYAWTAPWWITCTRERLLYSSSSNQLRPFYFVSTRILMLIRVCHEFDSSGSSYRTMVHTRAQWSWYWRQQLTDRTNPSGHTHMAHLGLGNVALTQLVSTCQLLCRPSMAPMAKEWAWTSSPWQQTLQVVCAEYSGLSHTITSWSCYQLITLFCMFKLVWIRQWNCHRFLSPHLSPHNLWQQSQWEVHSHTKRSCSIVSYIIKHLRML